MSTPCTLPYLSFSLTPVLQNTCSPPSLIFSHPKRWCFIPLLIHPKPTSFTFPAFLTESPCNVHRVYPVYPHPSPSRRSPNVSVPHCFVFPCPSCLLLPLLYILCVSSYTSLDIVYKNNCPSLPLICPSTLLLVFPPSLYYSFCSVAS